MAKIPFMHSFKYVYKEIFSIPKPFDSKYHSGNSKLMRENNLRSLYKP